MRDSLGANQIRITSACWAACVVVLDELRHVEEAGAAVAVVVAASLVVLDEERYIEEVVLQVAVEVSWTLWFIDAARSVEGKLEHRSWAVAGNLLANVVKLDCLLAKGVSIGVKIYFTLFTDESLSLKFIPIEPDGLCLNPLPASV